jgi:hypothetical protein
MDQPNHSTRLALLNAVALASALAVAAAYAFYDQFSLFAWTDDEGFAMMTVRHMLDGHRLYDDVMVFYGPGYNFVKWLLHGPVFGIPLTHDNIRLVGIGWLIASSMGLAFAARQEHPTALAVTFVVVLIFLHLPFRREPGHPQELIAVAVCLMPLASASIAKRPLWSAAALGLLAAFAGLSKINVGVFSVVGIGLGLSYVGMRFDRSTWALVTRGAAVLASTLAAAFVLALTFRHLGEAWVTALVLLVLYAILVLSLVSWCERRDFFEDGKTAPVPLVGSLVAFSVAGLVLTGLMTGFFMLRGTTLAAMKEALVDIAGRVPDAVEFRLYNSPLKLSIGLVPSVALMAIYLLWRRRGRPIGLLELTLGLGKLASGALFLGAGVLSRHTSGLILLPLVWLAIFELPGESIADSNDSNAANARRVRRILVAFIAAMQPLQMFPVAGSQRNIGGVLSIYLGILVFYDAVAWLRRRSSGSSITASLVRWAPAATLMASMGILALNTKTTATAYYAGQPLNLPGAKLLRLPDGQVAALHFLVDLVKSRSGSLTTLPGLNSLYFWTATSPPTLDVVTVSAEMLTQLQQQSIGDAAIQSEQALVLLQRPREGEKFVGIASHRATPLEERLRQELKLAGLLVCPETSWDLELRVQPASPALEWLDCVRWIPANATGQMTWPFQFRVPPQDAVRVVIEDPKNRRVLADTQNRPTAAVCRLLSDAGAPLDAVPASGQLQFTPLEPIDALSPWIARFFNETGRRERTLPVVVTPEEAERLDE